MLIIHSRILGACCLCYFIVACDKQEQTTPIEKTTKIRTETEPEQTTTSKTAPELNLSIDNIRIEQQSNGANNFIQDKESTEKNSALFETLNKDQTKTHINLSGKLLTDEDKLENKEYLESVDGVQINIEGNFD